MPCSRESTSTHFWQATTESSLTGTSGPTSLIPASRRCFQCRHIRAIRQTTPLSHGTKRGPGIPVPGRAEFIRAVGKEAGDSRIWAGIHYEWTTRRVSHSAKQSPGNSSNEQKATERTDRSRGRERHGGPKGAGLSDSHSAMSAKGLSEMIRWLWFWPGRGCGDRRRRYCSGCPSRRARWAGGHAAGVDRLAEVKSRTR